MLQLRAHHAGRSLEVWFEAFEHELDGPVLLPNGQNRDDSGSTSFIRWIRDTGKEYLEAT